MHRELNGEDDMKQKNPDEARFSQINRRITHERMTVLIVGVGPYKEQEIPLPCA
jgi:hypothetical protein